MGKNSLLSRLPAKMQKHLKNFLDDLKAIYSDQLISVILYGSAAGEDFVVGRSDINTLVILKKVTFQALKKYLPCQKKYQKQNIVAPLFLEPEYIQTSADTFPIEFLDIKARHQVLYGEDFFSKIEVPLKNLRLQCEQEIKGKLVRLRQHFLEVGSSPSKLEKLISSSFSSLVPIWRNLLRLKGKNHSKNIDDLFNQIETEFNYPSEVFRKIWKFKKNQIKFSAKELEPIFADYLDKIQEFSDLVDQLNL